MSALDSDLTQALDRLRSAICELEAPGGISGLSFLVKSEAHLREVLAARQARHAGAPDPVAAERERIAGKLMNTAGEVERHRMPGLRMQAANKVLEWIASQLRAGRY